MDIFFVLSSVGVRYWSYCCVRWKLVTFLISFSSNCARLRRNKVSLALNARGSFGHPPVSLWSPSGPLLVSRRSPLHYTQKSLSANIPVRISSCLNLLPRTVHSYGAGTRRLPTGIFAPRGRLLVSVDILRCVFYHGAGHAGASGYYEYASISCMHHWPYAGDQAAKRWYSSVSVWLVSLILKLESVHSQCRDHASGVLRELGSSRSFSHLRSVLRLPFICVFSLHRYHFPTSEPKLQPSTHVRCSFVRRQVSQLLMVSCGIPLN